MIIDKKILKYLERIDIFPIFAAENNRASEYRVGLQFRREGFRGPVFGYWSIAARLGLGKGKVYSNDDCACYIERRFASLCVTVCGEPLSHSTLRNLTVTSNSDQIHCDYPGKDGLLFHIPSQLGCVCP